LLPGLFAKTVISERGAVQKGHALSTLVHNGTLDEYLPFNMRSTADNAIGHEDDAVQYIRDLLKDDLNSKTGHPYEYRLREHLTAEQIDNSGIHDLSEADAERAAIMAEADIIDDAYSPDDIVFRELPKDANEKVGPDVLAKGNEQVAAGQSEKNSNGGKESVRPNESEQGATVADGKRVAAEAANTAKPVAAVVSEARKGKSKAQVAPAAVVAEARAARAAAEHTAEELAAVAELKKLLDAKFSQGPQEAGTPLTAQQKAQIFPILSKLFDQAFQKGITKFREAAAHVLATIRKIAGDVYARAITLAHLQGAYIASAGDNPSAAVDDMMAVGAVRSLEELQPAAAKEAENVLNPGDTTEPNRQDTTAAPQVDASAVLDEPTDVAGDFGDAGQTVDEAGSADAGNSGVPTDGAVAGGERSNKPLHTANESAGTADMFAGDGVGTGSAEGGARRVSDDAATNEAIGDDVGPALNLGQKLAAQRAAESVAVKTTRPRPASLCMNGKLAPLVSTKARRPGSGLSSDAHSVALRSGPTRLNFASSPFTDVPCPINTTNSTSSLVIRLRRSVSTCSTLARVASA
ncbi:MAG: hypothetical protein ACREMY_03850, partial [bacterium]